MSCLTFGVLAQGGNQEDRKFCGSTESRDQLFEDVEPFKVQDSLDQAQFQLFYENFMQQQAMSGTEDSAWYVIPVVFHVVHLNGNENISDAQIYDALEILNRDFAKENADTASVVSAFTNIIGDSHIEFRLASRDPNGNCHKGITRTYSNNTFDQGMTFSGHPIVDDVKAEHGTWAQNKYMNVFICIDPNGAAGYTFNPGNWLPETDMYGSIFMSHDYMGSIGTSNVGRSRTLTHEVGHWLNLSHPWGPNNNPGNASSCSTDDGVTDTPNTIGWQTCNTSGATCGSLDNVENYMDYSYCSKMFTNGQVVRMHAALNSNTAGRNDLWQNSNLIATGTLNAPGICEADFEADHITICAGSTVEFEDLSYHNASSWDWSFTGGTPSTSTQENPSVVYATPGTYTVALTAGDGSTTTTETKTAYITVLPNDALAVPYSEGFETLSALPNNSFFLDNPDGGISWEITSAAANIGSKSVYINNNASNSGNFDTFISNTMDLTGSSSVTLSFDYAYAQRTGQESDALKVYVSRDCGETWSLRRNMVGVNMATAASTTGTFVPGASEWTHVDITNIVSSYFVEGFRFKFEFESDGGNRIYVDNINLDGILGVPYYSEESINLNVYPNPVNDQATVTFESAAGSYVTVVATDLSGRLVERIYSGNPNTGVTALQWDTNELSNGIYLLNLTIDGQQFTRKVVVE